MTKAKKCEPVGQQEVGVVSERMKSVLDKVLRGGSRRMLVDAIPAEVEANMFVHVVEERRFKDGILVTENAARKFSHTQLLTISSGFGE